MARGGRGGSAPPRRTVDLTGIITSTEKSDLVLTVVAILQMMLRNINNLFDSPQIPLMQGEGPDRNWLALALRQQESNDKENAVPPRSFANIPIQSSARKPSPNRQDQDVKNAPQLQELKNEAVAFFNKWQASVLQRLRDLAVTTMEDDVSRRGRGRGARGMPRGRAGRGAGRAGKQNGRGGTSIAPTTVVHNGNGPAS